MNKDETKFQWQKQKQNTQCKESPHMKTLGRFQHAFNQAVLFFLVKYKIIKYIPDGIRIWFKANQIFIVHQRLNTRKNYKLKEKESICSYTYIKYT